MLSYPTDLNSEEQKLAETLLRELAEKFTADGTLHTPQWREVFQRTWRHPYVPTYYPTLDAHACSRSTRSGAANVSSATCSGPT